MGTAYRSPRLSPLHSFDSMIKDHHQRKKMHSEFPFAKRPTKSFKYDPGSHSMMTTMVKPTTTFPEVIEEDKAEAENQVSACTGHRQHQDAAFVDRNQVISYAETRL